MYTYEQNKTLKITSKGVISSFKLLQTTISTVLIASWLSRPVPRDFLFGNLSKPISFASALGGIADFPNLCKSISFASSLSRIADIADLSKPIPFASALGGIADFPNLCESFSFAYILGGIADISDLCETISFKINTVPVFIPSRSLNSILAFVYLSCLTCIERVFC